MELVTPWSRFDRPHPAPAGTYHAPALRIPAWVLQLPLSWERGRWIARLQDGHQDFHHAEAVRRGCAHITFPPPVHLH